MTAYNTTAALIVGVRFFKVGKLYHFDASHFPSVQKGDRVIVETKRGTQMGEVVKFVEPAAAPDSTIKSIDRIATPRDLVMAQEWQSKELGAMIECRARASQLHLHGIKIVKAEYNYDGTRLTFLFSSDADDNGRNDNRVETKSLQPDMATVFAPAHVELHQIGPRDVAKIIGGPGACGIEERCCTRFLTEFSPVSIKMAKEQGISLNPEEITGMCGRLRCCLVYEYEQYVEARKTLPRIKKRVGTPRGEGKVVDLNPMKQTVIVYTEDGRFEFHRDEIVPLDELQALANKANAPCSRHEGGGCDCGKAPRQKVSFPESAPPISAIDQGPALDVVSSEPSLTVEERDQLMRRDQPPQPAPTQPAQNQNQNPNREQRSQTQRRDQRRDGPGQQNQNRGPRNQNQNRNQNQQRDQQGQSQNRDQNQKREQSGQQPAQNPNGPQGQNPNREQRNPNQQRGQNQNRGQRNQNQRRDRRDPPGQNQNRDQNQQSNNPNPPPPTDPSQEPK
jgi:cell fate regulator YaaT (PSP1 superfamily)